MQTFFRFLIVSHFAMCLLSKQVTCQAQSPCIDIERRIIVTIFALIWGMAGGKGAHTLSIWQCAPQFREI